MQGDYSTRQHESMARTRPSTHTHGSIQTVLVAPLDEARSKQGKLVQMEHRTYFSCGQRRFNIDRNSFTCAPSCWQCIAGSARAIISPLPAIYMTKSSLLRKSQMPHCPLSAQYQVYKEVQVPCTMNLTIHTTCSITDDTSFSSS